MQVTSENFQQILPLFEESIGKADFVAIDTEFTGKKALLEGCCSTATVELSALDPAALTKMTPLCVCLIGFNVGELDVHNDYDTVQERYSKIRHEVQRFRAFQVGICAFRWCARTKKYLARPFCFYIFPHSAVL